VKGGRKLPSAKKEREQAAPSDFSRKRQIIGLSRLSFSYYFILNGPGTGTGVFIQEALLRLDCKSEEWAVKPSV
jgi:hypothetical protein